MAEGFDVAVEEGICRVAKSYQRAGVSFPADFQIFEGRWPEGQVVLWPPGRRSAAAAEGLRGVRSLEFTGWAVHGGLSGRSRWGRRGDASLPFSDPPIHARADVVWINDADDDPGPRRMALRFTGFLSESDRNRLVSYLGSGQLRRAA